jgi:hypothetical protein
VIDQIRGRAVERHPDPQLKRFDAMSRKYIGIPWPYREENSPIVLIIEVAKALNSNQPIEHMPPAAA